MLILAGDVGGTNTRLLATQIDNAKKFNFIARHDYLSSHYPDLSTIVKKFLHDFDVKTTSISAAAFGVAGAVENNSANITHLPWNVDAKELSKNIGIAKIAIINDFVAIGHGIETLTEQDICILQEGRVKENANRVILGAGTGLGTCFMHWCNSNYVTIATESGHSGFAPANELQIDLLKFLQSKNSHVSWEMVLSGPGLVNIYEYLREIKFAPENSELREFMQNGDAAALISEYAQKHHDPLAAKTWRIFVEIYGNCAGDLACMLLPYGGIYIAGGIAPKNLTLFNDGRFIEAFRNKGRLTKILEQMPVGVILNSSVGLQGASLFASYL